MTIQIPQITFNVDNIPAELKARRQWICWRYQVRDDKLVKVPLAPWAMGDDRPVSVTDPNNCTDLSTAVGFARKSGMGVGFVFFKGAGVVGVDLDKLDDLGEEAKGYIQAAGSYCEYSPSGRGVHIYGWGKLDRAIKKGGVEVYCDARFFTVTGNRVDGSLSTLGNIQPLLDDLAAKYCEKGAVEVKPQHGGDWDNSVNRLGYTLKEICGKDEILHEYLRGGLGLKPSASEADMGTLERLLFWGYEPNEAVAILERYRWRQKLQRGDYVESMLKKLLPVRETARPRRQDSCRPEEPVVLGHLNMIENPDYAGKPVLAEAVVSSTSVSYLAPSDVEATFEDEDGYTTNQNLEIDAKNPVNIKLVACNEEIKYRRLKRLFNAGKEISVSENAFRTVYLVRVRPPVFTLEKRGNKIVDDKGFEYKAFDIYVTSDKHLMFQPSSAVQFEGLPIPNPRTQRTTLLAYRVQFPEENHVFDMDKLRVLKAKFHDKTVKERLNWILDNFEAYSQIVKRRNLAAAGFLCFYTPTWIRFGGETQKGWANILFCGDTTTAKTETIRKMIQLLKAGMLVTAETASTVGLTGTATQVEGEGWFVDWGFLVLLDRKLLALDGAHKLSAANWASLAESERSGVVSIAKAAKSSAYARTRQLKVANAVDREADKYTTKSLGNFLYPCQALASVLDKTSIARLDLAVFADQRDVPPEDINRGNNADYDRDIELLTESLKWCWSDLAEVKFTDEAACYLREQASSLYHDFFCEMIPLASIDLKWKLARLSAALAFMTLSTEDFSAVTVTEEHVEAVVDFMREEYSKASLNALAQEERFEVYTSADVERIILATAAQASIERDVLAAILKLIVHKGRVTRDQLKTQFNLAEKNQLRPLMASLENSKLIQRRNGYYPTSNLINLYKVMTTAFLPTLPTLPESEKTPQFCE